MEKQRIRNGVKRTMNIENVEQSVVFEDKEGNRLAQYQEVQSFEGEESLAKVRVGESWIIINRPFEEISKDYKVIGDFMEELTVAMCKDESVVFVNKDGEEICRPFDNVWQFSKGRALVQYGSQFFFINKDGERIGPKFDFIAQYGRLGKNMQVPSMGSAKDHFSRGTDFQPYKGWCNGFAIIYIDGKQGIIDHKAHLITEVCYDEICLNGIPKDSPYIPVSKNGKWGYVDRRTGEEVTSLLYDAAAQHIELTSITKLSKNGRFGFIDRHGFELCPFEYDRIGNFVNGVAVVRIGREYNYIRQDNFTLISDTNFLNAYPFLGGFGEVIKKSIFGRKTRYIDKQGRLFKKMPW